jgi:site-specific DNA recombinase
MQSSRTRPQTQTKQFVAWARVSSDRQKKEGFSLQDQEARLTEFAQRLGGGIIKLFKIAETASKRDERDTFREFTTYVKRHHHALSGMLFVKVDRAARNIRDWADLEALADATGVPLFFPDQPTGETPAGRMQRRMSAVFASYQTDQQATDISAGIRRRIENGLPMGRQYGYRNVRVNGRSIIEHDPIEAPKVRRVFELFAYQPLTLDSLSETLARQGIIYSDRKPQFHRATLYRMLNNRHYIGDVQHKGQWYKGTFEPIVDVATFHAATAKFAKKVYVRPQITFAGELICCGHCGKVITGETVRKRSPDGTRREYSYYRCTQYSKPGHPKVRLTEREVEAQFLAVFDSLRIQDPAIQAWFVQVIKARASAEQQGNAQHRAELERQKTQVEAKLKTLLELRMDGEIDADEYAVKRAELHDRQTAVRGQLELSDRDDRDVAELAIRAFELSQSVVNRWKLADFHAKRTILGIMCERVQLNSQKLEIHLRKPFDSLRSSEPVSISGAEENRTLDLVIANDALYQLSYRPMRAICTCRHSLAAWVGSIDGVRARVTGLHQPRQPACLNVAGPANCGTCRGRHARGVASTKSRAAVTACWVKAWSPSSSVSVTFAPRSCSDSASPCASRAGVMGSLRPLASSTRTCDKSASGAGYSRVRKTLMARSSTACRRACGRRYIIAAAMFAPLLYPTATSDAGSIAYCFCAASSQSANACARAIMSGVSNTPSPSRRKNRGIGPSITFPRTASRFASASSIRPSFTKLCSSPPVPCSSSSVRCPATAAALVPSPARNR